MSWYPDLGTECMADSGNHVRAVGWLSSEQSFPTGDVPNEVRDRVFAFVRQASDSVKALGWGFFMGFHTCELCGQSTGVWNFGVPHGELLYAAPEMLGHYIVAHRYLPPAAFMEAILQAPLPATEEYRLLAAPFRELQHQRHERYRQETIEHWAKWIVEQGRTTEAFEEAVHQLLYYFGNMALLRERLQQAMPK